MFEANQSFSELAKLIEPYLGYQVQIEEGTNDEGMPVLRLIDHDDDYGIEITSERRSSMHGYSTALRINEVDVYEVPDLTDKQKAFQLERGRIGHYLWNRSGTMEGPLRVSENAKVVQFVDSSEEGLWHADGRFAWAGDTKHLHPRDLVQRIIPPGGEEPDEA